MSTGQMRARGRRRSARRGWRRRVVRRLYESEVTWFVVLLLATVGIAVAVVEATAWVPVSAFILPALAGGMILSVNRLMWLLAAVLFCLVGSLLLINPDMPRLGAGVVVVLVGVVMILSTRSRSQLGVTRSRGENMLIDLRDRLLNQSEMPKLPRSWYAEAVLRSAGGASFAGDFMVATKTHGGQLLEVAVVDVSGKGIPAGTRALQLSGAFGGLLGALPPAEFLGAANGYLLRQEWGEGFATAVHLVLDLSTGEFEVRTAGHPPALQFQAGSGRWLVHESEGPVLGLMEKANFVPSGGRLKTGDALLLYTDGLVETPQRDISMGIDKLLGEAERMVAAGFERAATRLVDRIASENDDRALLLLHRR